MRVLFISDFWLTTYKFARHTLAHCLYRTCLHNELDEWKIKIFYVEPGSFKTTQQKPIMSSYVAWKLDHISAIWNKRITIRNARSPTMCFSCHLSIRELKNCKDIKVKTLCALASVAPLPCNNVPSQSIVWTKVWPDSASRVTVTFFFSFRSLF